MRTNPLANHGGSVVKIVEVVEVEVLAEVIVASFVLVLVIDLHHGSTLRLQCSHCGCCDVSCSHSGVKLLYALNVKKNFAVIVILVYIFYL